MSAHDNEELIDYEDEHDVVPNGPSAPAVSSAGADDKDKKNFSGIHSTGFLYVIAPNGVPATLVLNHWLGTSF